MNKKIFLSLLLTPFILAACTGATDPANGGDDVQYAPHSLGSGPIYVEKFSDFQCPACKNMDAVVTPFVKENLDNITFVYKHFPLGQHPEAKPAAHAAECAAQQDQFFEYKDQLFANQSNLGDALYDEIAKDLALDEVAFEACLKDREVQKKITADSREGAERGVDSTPTFFVSTGIGAPQKVDNPDLMDYLEEKIGELGEDKIPVQESSVENELVDSTSDDNQKEGIVELLKDEKGG